MCGDRALRDAEIELVNAKEKIYKCSREVRLENYSLFQNFNSYFVHLVFKWEEVFAVH